MAGKRLSGIDYLRVLSIFPIVHFHSWEAAFFLNTTPGKFDYWPHTWMEAYSAFMSFSGFTVVLIFYFLMGYKKTKILNKKKIGLLFVGIVGLSLACSYIFGTDFLVEWDIYHFLILTYLMFLLVSRFFKFSKLELGFFYFLALMPFWKLTIWVGPSAIWIGDCSGGTGLWPLFPNLFVIFFAYSLGGLCFDTRGDISKKQGAWAVLAGSGFLAVTAIFYYRFTLIGEGFGCYIHQPPFWAWFCVVTGLGLLVWGLSSKSINDRLQGKLSAFLGGLAWNKSFGYCYLVQWLFLAVLYAIRGVFDSHPGLFFLVPLAIIVATEYTVRALKKIQIKP